MINIYDVNGKVLMQAEITSSAIREEELSKSDYISLSWNSAEKVILPAGAYIVHTYKIDKVREVTRQFLLLESYEPTQSDEMSWKYTPEFQHPKMVLSKIPFFIRTRNSKNEVIKQYNFDFCGTMVTIADKLKDFLNNELKFGNAGWLINYDTANTNAINVSFSDNDFISALTAITNAIGDNCEWHIDYDNETIHIGNVLRDDLPIVTLKVGENVSIPSINNSKEDYYNAFAVFGGTRNITQVNDKGENISSSDIKLQLSKGSGITEIDGKKLSYSIDEFSTIDMRQNKNEQLFTKILNFAQIYPSLNTYVYNVRGREKYVLQDGNKIPLTYNADGSVKIYKTFTVWYVRMAYPTTEKIANKKLVNTTVDNGVTHYWYDFEVTDDLLINGKNIGCSFEANFNEGALSTPLAGRGTNGDYVGFELTYHKEASSTHTTDDVDSSNFAVLAGDFEIIYQEDNDLIIPTNAKDMIIPKGESLPSYKCNITVLYNIAMAESIYKKDAQKRLLDAAMKEIKRLLSDLNNYSVKSYPQVFEAKNPCLQIGQKVVYDDGNGYQLNTRAQKISTNIDFEFVQEITVGNEVIKGNTAQLKEDVKEIIASGGSGSGGGGNYTTSQLRNLISKYGIGYFVSKMFDDVVKGTITFEKVQVFLKGLFFGQGYGFSESGQGIIKELTSDGFNSASQQGFGIMSDNNGRYSLSITDLIVWGKAVFNELEIRKVSYAGGNIYLSGAGSKLVKVVPVVYNSEVGEYSISTDEECDGWKCYILADDGTMATQNLWVVGDQARCQTFNIKPGAYDNASNREYWRCVVAVSSESEYIVNDGGESLYGDKKFDWVVLSKTNCLANSDIPAEGDAIVLDGHQIQTGEESNISRTNVLMLESSGADTPRIVGYRGITDFTHKDKDVFVISPSNVTISSSVFKFKAASGQDITIINDRGAYDSAVGYYYYDRVSYDNAYWTFIYNGDKQPVKGITPTVEAVDGTVYWRKDLSGGIKGDNAVSYSVQFSESTATISGVATKILNVTFVKSVGLQISSGGLRDIGFDGTCIVYVDGVRNDGMTNNLMLGYTYLDIYNAFANEIKGKKSLSVELRDSDNRVVASNIFFFAEKGDKGDKGDQGVKGDQGDKGEQGIKGDKGEDGANGTDGEDAVSILVEDAPLIFDTDNNGIVPVSISKAAKVKVIKGNLNISNECSNINSRDDLCVNCKCGATQKAGYIEVSVSGSNIAKNDVVIDGVNQGKVSATSGYAVVQLTYNGVTYFAQVPFSVNVAKFTGVVAFDNKSYKQQFEEVSNRLDGAATKDELTHAKSEFEQTARKISLSVSEKSIARRNLLVGSAFLREDNNCLISRDARIEINSGYQGTNCIKVIDDTDGTSHYIGVYWDGSQGGRSVKIEKGKKYTISCYYKTNDTNAKFSLEAIYTDKETNAKRLGRPKFLSPSYFNPKYSQWELFTTVIDTTDAESDYIAFNFWEYCNNKVGRLEAYICRPMVEEGDTYYGWTLSQDDYDIIGANLIDNSRTLDAGGNVIEAKGQKALVGDAYELTASGSDDFNTFYRIKGSTFKLGVDYTISFEVRGDAKYMGVYVSYPITNTKFTCYKEPQNGAMNEATGDGKTVGYVALVEVKELSKQQRVWGHFRFKDRLPEELYFQFPSNTEQTDVTSWNVTITKPKIEVGAVVTEYTERKSDLVDKASLKKAGIEVRSDEVLLYGDRIRVDNNGQTAAMFIGGKLNSNFIDADKIEVKHLWAKSENGTTKVGYFGNYEIDACKVNDTYAPLFVGADTAAKALFYVSKDGYMNAKAGKIGSFLISPTGYTNSIIAGTWKDATNIDINKFGTRLELSDTKLEFLYGSGSAIGGDVVYSSTNAQIAIDPSKARHGFTSCGLDIRVDVFAATACGIHLDVSGFLGDPAIYIKNGTVWGFRPHIVSVGSDYHLRDDDTVVMCTNWNNNITLTLPDDPQHGQYYVVIHRGRNITFKSNADQIMTKNNPSGVSSFGDSTFYQINWIFYDGEQWILIYKT